VRVRTGPLSQVQQGPKWQERATRKCPVYRALNSGETENRRHSRRSSRRATVAGRSVGESGNHWRPTESYASVQDLSLRFSKVQSGRSAQRASALSIVLSAVVRLEAIGDSRRPQRRDAIAGRSVGESGTHQQRAESCASVQDLSLKFSKVQSGRSAQRASALSIVLSALVRLEIVGALDGREGEQPSRVGQSAKAALTGNAQGRERPYRTSLSGSARPKVAGARNAQVPCLSCSQQW
jgi:hypothetical protein